jgi:transposase
MARLLPDHVWTFLESEFPQRPPPPKGGRPVLGDRDVLTGILFVLKTGIAWDDLPLEMGCGCGVTCLRRLRQWHESGTWQRVAELLQQSLAHAQRIDWTRAEIEAANRPRRRRRMAVMPRGRLLLDGRAPAGHPVCDASVALESTAINLDASEDGLVREERA